MRTGLYTPWSWIRRMSSQIKRSTMSSGLESLISIWKTAVANALCESGRPGGLRHDSIQTEHSQKPVLLQLVDRFHVTGPKVIHLDRIEKAVREYRGILKKDRSVPARVSTVNLAFKARCFTNQKITSTFTGHNQPLGGAEPDPASDSVTFADPQFSVIKGR